MSVFHIMCLYIYVNVHCLLTVCVRFNCWLEWEVWQYFHPTLQAKWLQFLSSPSRILKICFAWGIFNLLVVNKILNRDISDSKPKLTLRHLSRRARKILASRQKKEASLMLTPDWSECVNSTVDWLYFHTWKSCTPFWLAVEAFFTCENKAYRFLQMSFME